MQLITVIGALALLSTSAMAVSEKTEKRSPDHWWQLRDARLGEYRHHHQAENQPIIAANAAPSSTTDETGVTTDAAFTTEIFALSSGDTTDFGAYTTIYFTEEPVATAPALGSTPTHKRHRTRNHHLALTSSPSLCPTTILTSVVTVTANVTSMAYVSLSPSYNSSSKTQASVGFPSSNANFSSTTTNSAPRQGFPSSNEVFSSVTATPSTSSTSSSGYIRHHTRFHHHVTFSTSSSIPTSIFVSASPVLVGSGTNIHPSSTVTPTTTITGGSIPTGTGSPNPGAYHCGVTGLPVGDYFLAEYVENKVGEDVTLLGCFEFCTSDYGYNQGCVAYEFYPEPGTGAPRCALFGGSVADSLASISNVPNVWYDLGCGNPVF